MWYICSCVWIVLGSSILVLNVFGVLWLFQLLFFDEWPSFAGSCAVWLRGFSLFDFVCSTCG